MENRATGSYELAILPWGATEAHNVHLPYGTDTIESGFIAAEAARLAWEAGAKVVVLPTVPFGVNTGQLDIPLCLSMNPSRNWHCCKISLSVSNGPASGNSLS